MSITFFQGVSQTATAEVRIWAVPSRRIHHKKLGQFFRQLRVDRGWGLRQAIEIARHRQIKVLTLNTLGTLERGSTKNPDPKVLQGVADLYSVNYDELAERVVADRYGVQYQGTARKITGQKSTDLTSSVTDSGVQGDKLILGGGTPDVRVGEDPAHRSPHAIIADVEAELDSNESIVTLLRHASESIQAAANALAGRTTSSPGADRTGRLHGPAPVGRKKTGKARS